MKITLYGAAGDVTGSAYYIQTELASFLIDFGTFQGSKEENSHNSIFPPIDCTKLNAVLLTHAHLDHSGRLPLLTKRNYSNPIYATPSTIELAELILLDSVKVQTSEQERINRKRTKMGLQPEEMPYSESDVQQVLKLFKPIPYNQSFEIAPGCNIRAHEAGHILGSVSYELTVNENGSQKVIVFSGDIGPYDMAIIQDPMPFIKADLVFMESTYGDRDHKSQDDTLTEGIELVKKAIKNKGKILVPAFAIGRTQELLYYMARAVESDNLPTIPIYLDSPMGIEASEIYVKHTELYDDEALDLLKRGIIKGDLSGIHVSKTSDESKALNSIDGPCMIIAGSGMCNAGRIMHHLRNNLPNPQTSLMITGYQGEGTLGRRLLDGAKTVRIFGEDIAVNAEVHSLNGLSAHAGQSDLLRWFDRIASTHPKLVLSHGEDRSRIPLAEIIEKKYGIKAILPKFGDVITL